MFSLAKTGAITAMLVPVVLVATAIGFGLAIPEFSQWRHPLTLLGATGVPHAMAYSLLGLVLPGLLALYSGVSVLASNPSRMLRIGLLMTVLSGVAFAAMGLLPLDPSDLNGRASQYHASAWLLWALASVIGTGWLGLSLRQHANGLALSGLSIAIALLIGMLSFFPPSHWLPAPFTQRLAFAAWALWWPALIRLWPNPKCGTL